MRRKCGVQSSPLFKLREKVGLERNFFAKFLNRSATMVYLYETGRYKIPEKIMDRAKDFVEEILKVYQRYERD